MELAEALRRRRMVRRYDPDRPVEPAALEAVLAAALRTPSAGFTQGVSLLVLATAEDRDAFWAASTPADADPDRPSRWLAGMRTAPVLVLLWTSREAYLDRYAQPDKGWSDRDPGRWSAPYWFVDAGMVALAGLLAAVDAGLGACFFGVPAERTAAVRAAFGVPEDQLGVGVLSLGHPAPDARPGGSAARRPRRPAAELVHRGRWSTGPLPPERPGP
ncbi:nitroreductase family protein [Microlunatus capsulatus]|uniref:Nitroreductase n=1 Tax=Microlunatus capsulatus TaxID=99117 RepID=A0ABS4ZAL0_9ACTN|nr:nitroreductase family protein [Microlunatus capsulatus]MBP2418089.1 nitroreductase [Microlunatus capsulatus]